MFFGMRGYCAFVCVYARAFTLKSWLYSHTLPCRFRVPLFRMTLIDAPPATPCSALNEFVVLLMSSRPLKFTESARDGFEAVEFCSCTPEAPGIKVYSA